MSEFLPLWVSVLGSYQQARLRWSERLAGRLVWHWLTAKAMSVGVVLDCCGDSDRKKEIADTSSQNGLTFTDRMRSLDISEHIPSGLGGP